MDKEYSNGEGMYTHKSPAGILQNTLCRHGKEKKPCPLCENGVDETLLDHVLKRHTYGGVHGHSVPHPTFLARRMRTLFSATTIGL